MSVLLLMEGREMVLITFNKKCNKNHLLRIYRSPQNNNNKIFMIEADYAFNCLLKTLQKKALNYCFITTN